MWARSRSERGSITPHTHFTEVDGAVRLLLVDGALRRDPHRGAEDALGLPRGLGVVELVEWGVLSGRWSLLCAQSQPMRPKASRPARPASVRHAGQLVCWCAFSSGRVIDVKLSVQTPRIGW